MSARSSALAWLVEGSSLRSNRWRSGSASRNRASAAAAAAAGFFRASRPRRANSATAFEYAAPRRRLVPELALGAPGAEVRHHRQLDVARLRVPALELLERPDDSIPGRTLLEDLGGVKKRPGRVGGAGVERCVPLEGEARFLVPLEDLQARAPGRRARPSSASSPGYFSIRASYRSEAFS